MKNRLFGLLIVIMFALSLVFVFSNHVANGKSPIFSDGFESGDTSAWTSVMGTPSVTNVLAYQGVYSLNCTADGQYVAESIPSSGDIFARMYVRFKNLQGTNAGGTIIKGLNSQSGSSLFNLVINYGYDNVIGWYRYWDLQTALNDLSWDYVYSNTSYIVNVDTWYCVEVHYQRNTAAGCEFYLDGAKLLTSNSSAPTRDSNTEEIRFGQPYFEFTCENYIDSIVIDSSYIGAATYMPTLQLTPTTETCRKYGETFTLNMTISDPVDVTSLEFEIHYNATLLSYSNVVWIAWTSGNVTVDQTNGVVNGSTSGTPLNDNQTLLEIQFTATYYHIWKVIPGWTNDVSDTIFIQSANLTSASKPDLTYIRGTINQINIGPDVNYTFSPIRGDVDNNGQVDVLDLRTVAIYYDQPNDTYNLVGDPTIDIYDLVIVASNLGYKY